MEVFLIAAGKKTSHKLSNCVPVARSYKLHNECCSHRVVICVERLAMAVAPTVRGGLANILADDEDLVGLQVNIAPLSGRRQSKSVLVSNEILDH